MKLSEFKNHLQLGTELSFRLPEGTFVPAHFHITEVGLITKEFIDCGGVVRREKVVSFQLWENGDFDHRLGPQKLSSIIATAEDAIGLADAEIEVEYQQQTIGKFGVEYDGKSFFLTQKFTTCLATDACGIPPEKMKVKLSELSTSVSSCCTPGGGCC